MRNKSTAKRQRYSRDMRGRKGIYLETVDYEKMFQRLSQPPIIVNRYNLRSEEEREELNSLIYTRYDGDTLANSPRCDCGNLKHGHNEGIVCPKCHSPVISVTEKPLESLLWMETPKDVPAFVQLQVWRILSKNLTYSGFNVLEYLTNPFYRPSVKSPLIVRKVDTLRLPMGLANFCRHYDEIIEALFKARIFRGKASQRDKLYRYLQMVRPVTFTKRLPFPSRLAFITEKNNDRIYADHKMTPALDAIWTVVALNSNTEPPSLKLQESSCVRAMNQLCTYYREFEKHTAFKKEGIVRKLICGTRPPWTYRTVISSQHGPHDYRCLSLPWGAATLLFKSHLANKLLKLEFTPNDIISLLYENTLRHHVLLERLFNELIDEAPGLGIPTTFARNPTLKRGSIQRFFIDEIKTDTSINTVSISTLCLKSSNADFDGKALPSLNFFNCWKPAKVA